MDDLRELLEQINQRLNSVLEDQALVYAKLEQLEDEMKREPRV